MAAIGKQSFFPLSLWDYQYSCALKSNTSVVSFPLSESERKNPIIIPNSELPQEGKTASEANLLRIWVEHPQIHKHPNNILRKTISSLKTDFAVAQDLEKTPSWKQSLFANTRQQKPQGQNKNMSSSIDINAHQNITWNHNSYS